MARRSKADRHRELSGIVYLACALLLGFAFYLPSGLTGWLGRTATELFSGLMGVVSYAVPAFLLYLSVESFREKRNAVRHHRYAYAFLIVLAVSALLHAFTVDQGVFRTLVVGQEGKPAWNAVKELWAIGAKHHPDMPLNGGLAGGLIATALTAVAGKVGAPILLLSFIVIQIVLLFDVSITRAVDRTSTVLNKTKSKVNEAIREQVRVLRERAEEREAATAAAATDIPAHYDHAVDTTESDNPLDAASSEQDSVQTGELENNRVGTVKTPLDLVPSPPEAFVPPSSDDSTSEHNNENVVLPAGIVRVPAGSGTEESAPAKTAEEQPVPATPKRTSRKGKRYRFPPVSLLNPGRMNNAMNNAVSVNALGRKLEETLASFGVKASVSNITSGPSITRFELTPGPGVKVSKIVNLSDDIALNLAAVGVRIEAPIPGKSAIGVEIPKKETARVSLRDLIESREFKSIPTPLVAALGRDIAGTPVLCDISRMPHLLIAGATGSGKSVCVNVLLSSVLFRAHPDEVKMILIDPKVVELSMYNGVPHLLLPVVTDPKKAANALVWAVSEMNSRYKRFLELSVRDIDSYNKAVDEIRSSEEGQADGIEDEEAEPLERMPLILIVIDELADLMMTSPREVEDSIARLTAMARAAGIHLVIATQRPSVDVITGVIKANIPSRMAFAVSSQVDSRTILDMGGAEKLLGKGDFLYFPQSAPKPVRGQGAMVTDEEVESVISFLTAQDYQGYDPGIAETVVAETVAPSKSADVESDVLLPKAVDVVLEAGYASVSLLQRRMKVGYPRAARLVDRMHEAGYIGPFEGSKPRTVLLTPQRWMEIQASAESREET